MAPPSFASTMIRESFGLIHRSWLSPWGTRAVPEGLAGVHRLQEGGVQDVDGVRVGRVGDHVAVVPAAAPQAAVAVHPRPGVSAILAPVETAPLLGGGDERVNPARIRRGDGHADAADRVFLGGFRQPAPEPFPRPAPVPGAVEAPLGAAVDEGPGLPLGLPHRGEESPAGSPGSSRAPRRRSRRRSGATPSRSSRRPPSGRRPVRASGRRSDRALRRRRGPGRSGPRRSGR